MGMTPKMSNLAVPNECSAPKRSDKDIKGVQVVTPAENNENNNKSTTVEDLLKMIDRNDGNAINHHNHADTTNQTVEHRETLVRRQNKPL